MTCVVTNLLLLLLVCFVDAGTDVMDVVVRSALSLVVSCGMLSIVWCGVSFA